MTKAAAIFFSCCALFASVWPAHAQTPPAPSPSADPQVYGEYQIAYKQIVGRWLETKLVDPTSAVIDWGDPPKPGEYRTQKGEVFVGYVVDFKVNARNAFGGPTGKQHYRVVLRNGDVLWGGRPRY